MNKELTPLEALEDKYRKVIAQIYYLTDMPKEERDKFFHALDEEFSIIEKSLKALEIIKKHYYYDKTLGLLHRVGYETKEEYYLLKEVLLKMKKKLTK